MFQLILYSLYQAAWTYVNSGQRINSEYRALLKISYIFQRKLPKICLTFVEINIATI